MSSKVILVTGASSGIGKAIGVYLKSKGFTVYGTSRNAGAYGPDFALPLVTMDVKNAAQVRAAVQEVIEKEGRLDVLVNNAGVGITGPVEEIPSEEMQHTLATNFYGPVHVSQAVLPQMRKQGSGLIVNITSIAAYMGLPYRGIYSASKAATEVLTEALRMEVKDFGVRVVNLAPGDFATNIAAGRYHAPLSADSPYAESYRKTLELVDSHVDEGNDPIEVAKKVHEIMGLKNPKIHYKVGARKQRFSTFLKKILPDKTFEKLLLKHYKL